MDVLTLVILVIRPFENVQCVFNHLTELKTVISEPSPQEVEPPPDLGRRFGRPRDVKRFSLVTELELNIAGVRVDIAEQWLHCSVVGVGLQSEGSSVGHGVAQQLSGVRRIDSFERRGFLHPIEKGFELCFFRFAEENILDAKAVGVDEEARHGKPAQTGLAG